MFGIDPFFLAGSIIGGILGIALLNLVFRYAFLGHGGTRLQRAGIVLLTGFSAVGIFTFNEGADGFQSRIQILGYGIATLFVLAIECWLTSKTPDHLQETSKIGRGISLLFVLPAIGLGLTGVGQGTYATLNQKGSLGVDREELRRIMLNGDLALFWQTVDDRAPQDLDLIIERMFAAEHTFLSEQDVSKALADEVVRFRNSLAVYGPALTDAQRKEILSTSVNAMLVFRDSPAMCKDIAVTGGANLKPDQLKVAGPEINKSLVATTRHLLDARNAASVGVGMPAPPSEADFAVLGEALTKFGLTEPERHALITNQGTDIDLCEASIKFSEAALSIGGSSGEALRFEFVQGMLAAAP